MSFLKRKKFESETDDELRKRLLKEEEREKLMERKMKLESQQVNRLKRMNDLKRERFDAEHPRTASGKKTLQSSGKRLVSFAGSMVKESAKSYGHFKGRMKRVRRPPNVQLRSRSFTAPDGRDLSMSEGIARNDWHGEKNIMNTNFFGNNQDRDFFGEGKYILGETKKELFSSDNKNKKRLI